MSSIAKSEVDEKVHFEDIFQRWPILWHPPEEKPQLVEGIRHAHEYPLKEKNMHKSEPPEERSSRKKESGSIEKAASSSETCTTDAIPTGREVEKLACGPQANPNLLGHSGAPNATQAVRELFWPHDLTLDATGHPIVDSSQRGCAEMVTQNEVYNKYCTNRGERKIYDPVHHETCANSGQLWAMIRTVTTLFDDLGIVHWASHGFLLGLLRHGGLIPNDCDADIVVPTNFVGHLIPGGHFDTMLRRKG